MGTIEKIFCFIIGFTILLTSCKQGEELVDIPDGSDRRITFNTSLPEVDTRSVITTDVPYFDLTAYNESDDDLIEDGKIMEYVDTERVNVVGKRTLCNNCEWPAGMNHVNDLLHFFAYYPELEMDAKPANITSVVGNSRNVGYKIDNFRVAEEIANQKDFVTAYANGRMSDDLISGIDLNFKHQLSQVEIKAKGSHKSCAIEIAGVRIHNAVMQADFEFQKNKDDWGYWNLQDSRLGDAGYIFSDGEEIVKVDSEEASIMGNGGAALLIPATHNAWKYDSDPNNAEKGMYISVLLRVVDKNGKQQYPYTDKSQGLNALNIPRVCFEAQKTSGEVSSHYFKKGDNCFSDEACTVPYTPTANESIETKEFGWASIPIAGAWQEAGKTYTITFDFSYGVGLHGPEVEGEDSPKAGDPIISDIIGIKVTVNGWNDGNNGNGGIYIKGNTTNEVKVPSA